jgi:hypothetical protein
MAQHGYLYEYDEGSEREDERQRGWRNDERDFMLGERGRDEWRREAPRQDAQYLSWRDRHMRELDRDYEEYRREREQQFHQDFDSWRRQRRSIQQPLQTGMTQTSTSGDTDGTLELTPEATQGGQDPMSSATMGTTSSGRGRR